MVTGEKFSPDNYAEAHAVLTMTDCTVRFNGAVRAVGKCTGIDAAYQANKAQRPEQTYAESLAEVAARRVLCEACPMNDLCEQEVILAEEASE